MRYELVWCVRGYHVYRTIWKPSIGERYKCIRRKSIKENGPSAVSVIHDELIVGHIPRKISYPVSLFLTKEGTSLFCEVTGTVQFSSDLPQGGLEIPCRYIFNGGKKDVSVLKRGIEGVFVYLFNVVW